MGRDIFGREGEAGAVGDEDGVFALGVGDEQDGGRFLIGCMDEEGAVYAGGVEGHVHAGGDRLRNPGDEGYVDPEAGGVQGDVEAVAADTVPAAKDIDFAMAVERRQFGNADDLFGAADADDDEVAAAGGRVTPFGTGPAGAHLRVG